MINKDLNINYIKEHIHFINNYPNNIGSKIYELEKDFKKYFNTKYASACSNGSAGLLLSLQSIGIKPGDEVMLNINYFISDPNSIKLLGAKPIFIDLGKNINSLSIEDIKRKITPKTKAIIIIHLYGYPIRNIKEIIDICKKKGIFIIEDCCQSIGAKIGRNYVGTLGDIGIFSFDSNKLVKGGEGGMVISNNKILIERINLFKNNYKKQGQFIKLGFNFRYNDFSAIYVKYSLRSLKNKINHNTKKSKLLGKILYNGGKNIFPSYYNFIIIRKEITYKKSNDFYNINYNKFINLKKHFKKYDII